MRHYFGRFTAMKKLAREGAKLAKQHSGWIKRSANDMNSFQLIPSDRDLRALVQLHPKQSSIPDTASRAVKIGRIIIIFKLYCCSKEKCVKSSNWIKLQERV